MTGIHTSEPNNSACVVFVVILDLLKKPRNHQRVFFLICGSRNPETINMIFPLPQALESSQERWSTKVKEVRQESASEAKGRCGNSSGRAGIKWGYDLG